MKNWKTVGFFAGLSSALVMVANVVSKYFGFEIESKAIEDVVMAICSLLVALGVVSVSVKPKTTQEKENNATCEFEEKLDIEEGLQTDFEKKTSFEEETKTAQNIDDVV